jgi:hypothetical protein
MTRKEEEALPEEFRDHGVQIAEDFVLTWTEASSTEIDGYFNHSCSPNTGYKGQIMLVAMKQINSDEEVTFDYGMVVFQSRNAKRYRIECQCGAKNCRGIITDNDWKIPELQKRYDGYFQWYLQDKIDRIKKRAVK